MTLVVGHLSEELSHQAQCKEDRRWQYLQDKSCQYLSWLGAYCGNPVYAGDVGRIHERIRQEAREVRFEYKRDEFKFAQDHPGYETYFFTIDHPKFGNRMKASADWRYPDDR